MEKGKSSIDRWTSDAMHPSQTRRSPRSSNCGLVLLLLALLSVVIVPRTSHSLLNHHNRCERKLSFGRRKTPTCGSLPTHPRQSSLILLSAVSTKTQQQKQQQKQQQQEQEKTLDSIFLGPSRETKPDYHSITGPMGKRVDDLLMSYFRAKLAEQVPDIKPSSSSNRNNNDEDFDRIIELASHMNRKVPDRFEIQRRAQQVLRNMFPSWLPGSYAVLFSKPFPAFSARMNAWATMVGGTWLMGECEVNDIPIQTDDDDDDVVIVGDGIRQGLHVKRCRFLEESGCASVCVNSCKIPTQNFFLHDMGLPLTMEPNYETFECQFSFGRMPSSRDEIDAKNVPCLSRCPTAGALRRWHDNSAAMNGKMMKQTDSDDEKLTEFGGRVGGEMSRNCELMDN